MSVISPSCVECGYDHAAYDYDLEDYFCAKCRHRAIHAERTPRRTEPTLPFEDPWASYTGDQMPEALR